MSEDWWLFIDGSVNSLKAVILHKTNLYSPLPIAYSREEKENYDTLSKLLHLIKYNSYQWKICSDLKVVGILMGLRKGFVKFSCFICLWDSSIEMIILLESQV